VVKKIETFEVSPINDIRGMVADSVEEIREDKSRYAFPISEK
jgi:hypothetical protein